MVKTILQKNSKQNPCKLHVEKNPQTRHKTTCSVTLVSYLKLAPSNRTIVALKKDKMWKNGPKKHCPIKGHGCAIPCLNVLFQGLQSFRPKDHFKDRKYLSLLLEQHALLEDYSYAFIFILPELLVSLRCIITIIILSILQKAMTKNQKDILFSILRWYERKKDARIAE